MNGFTIYKEYYELITLLTEKEQQEILLAIIKYMFEDIEPTLNGRQIKIFNNLKRPLDKSKKKGKNGSTNKSNQNQNEIKIKSKTNQNEIKNKSNQNQKEIKSKSHQDVNVNVNVNDNNNYNYKKKNIKKKSYYENENLNELFVEFLQLREKLKAVNTERAVNILINKLSSYDDETKKAMIKKSIENSWKSVYEIKKEELPKWFNKDIKVEPVTKEELEEMENLLKEFR